MEPDFIERRREQQNGWTWWKEIVGTGIAVAAVMTPVCIALIAWGSHVETTIAVSQQRLSTLELARSEILTKLDKISDQVEIVSQRVSGMQQTMRNGR